MIKTTKLKSGLRVLTIPQQNTRTVTVLVLVGTGSKYEEKRVNGVSHFLEHMFFKGTKKRPTPLKIAGPIENVGGALNAFTSQDLTGYYIKVDASHLKLALDMVADIFLNSLLAQKEITKEKGVVIEEINMRKDIPMIHVADLLEQFLYGDQPAGWDTAGTKETVQGLSQADLLSYMQSQYVASNTVVCVAGNIKEEKVKERVGKLFSSISLKNFKDKVAVHESQEKPKVLLEHRATDQTHLAFAARGFNLSHKDRFVQEIIAAILGGGMSSRLFTEVREKLGLAYYISTSSESNPDTGFLATFAGVKNENAQKVVGIIAKEYKKLAVTKITSTQLRNAKDRIKGRMALSLESSDAKAEFYGMQEILEHRFFTPEQLYDKIEKVKVSDIQRVAKNMFTPKNLNLVILGPFTHKQRFQKFLS
ncbi:insulinase family protein [Patescibacteria group bacterium]|nr:insulinase family protein [Patescibacteria group bacterium]